MPGDSPYEATGAFLEPLQRALGCLGTCKISTTAQGRHKIHQTHAWTINGGTGLQIRPGVFYATMDYEIVLSESPDAGKWRVSTRGYAYRLADNERRTLWAMHWHPVGRSPATFPHVHIPALNERGHFPTERMTFEHAVRWCIESGAEPKRDDWEQVLAESEGIHKLYRSWADTPPKISG